MERICLCVEESSTYYEYHLLGALYKAKNNVLCLGSVCPSVFHLVQESKPLEFSVPTL
jgi:hypothetical protein